MAAQDCQIVGTPPTLRKVTPPKKQLVSSFLLWFEAHARDLPWRRSNDPYAIWVSEIMLQQTQARTVVPYFERWMRQLPDLAALAQASPEKLHKLWEGLGYYTRVRNLQKAAQVILRDHAGAFPRKFDDVLSLPGIGRYTAGAICSIAFGEPRPILDGNVMRVLSRVFALRGDPREQPANAQLWKLAEELVRLASIGSPEFEPPQNPKNPDAFLQVTPPGWAVSAFNQSLMELGAMVCTPRNPRCEICPASRFCRARKLGHPESFPEKRRRIQYVDRRYAVFILNDRGRFLVRQRPADVVNGHLWEFPNEEIPPQAPKDGKPEALAGLAEAVCGCNLQTPETLGTVKHTITRNRITLHVYLAKRQAPEARQTRAQGAEQTWLTPSQLQKLPFAGGHRRIRDALFARSSPTSSASSKMRFARPVWSCLN